MSPRQNDENGGESVTQIPFGRKAAYIGSGILIGLIIYPFVKKAIGKVQPRMDELIDQLTGKAENLAEKASDLMARARETLGRADENEGSHSHDGHGSPSRRSAPDQS